MVSVFFWSTTNRCLLQVSLFSRNTEHLGWSAYPTLNHISLSIFAKRNPFLLKNHDFYPVSKREVLVRCPGRVRLCPAVSEIQKKIKKSARHFLAVSSMCPSVSVACPYWTCVQDGYGRPGEVSGFLEHACLAYLLHILP